ncbi:MAG: dehydrogenase [Chloroflexi bacterium]|nr:dehydrogenase [Chloroflexota bacterium]MBS32805.1 dehydrogenase [Verrucomicrobiales bacterium]HCU73584.1 dehydrogenase [Chloroflexota bacterium]|tara:strand:+ start:539 stop:1318 length:780 start_codon:yes stop_codon:yes gene_type:complete
MANVSYDFRGHSALVTGGTQGIGLSIAEAFVRAGANVAICARTGTDITKTCESLRSLGAGTVCGVTADLADPNAPASVFAEAVDCLGNVDILVNNAAAQGNFPFPEMNGERWRWMADVNLHAPYELSRLFVLALQKRNQGGSIVNMVTTQVMRHAKGRVGYGATKLGLVGITQTMALELASTGIRVNAVAPAFVDVPRVYRDFDDVEDRMAGMPSGRFIRPDEIADATLFLASDAAESISGVVLPVDGAHHIDGTWVRD